MKKIQFGHSRYSTLRYTGVLAMLGGFAMLAIVLSSASANAAEDEYLFLLKGRGNVFWKIIKEGVEATAKSSGIHAVILNTDDDQNPEAQLNMCTASLSRKPKVLVMGAATKNVGIECFKKAVAQGVMVADIDGNVTLEDGKAAGVPMSFSVGSDNVLIGKSAGEFLVNGAPSKTPRILVIKGLPGSIVSEKRAQGFLNLIQEQLPNAVIVGKPSADWDRMKAMNTSLDFMQREPELDYIFSVSDVMTMGVIEAVRVAGKKERVKVISVDGIAEARKAVSEGKMLANVAQLPFLMGKRAVELAMTAAKGETKDHNEFTPTPVLTKEVLDKNDSSVLQYVR